MSTKTTVDRFWAKVIVTNSTADCWEWTAATHHFGYGLFWDAPNKRMVVAHRYSYVWLRGEIPEHLVCDHLCRNPGCVNPWHLELVTTGENTRRGIGRTGQTHCKHGHEFTEDNIIWAKRKKGSGVARICKACNKRWGTEYFARCQARRSTQP